jgi:hypothetical protein
MLQFSRDPQIAEQQMQAVLFALTAFGHIDGDFDEPEREFIRAHVRTLVAHRVQTGMPDAPEDVKADLQARFTTHFLEAFEQIEAWVLDVLAEPVGQDESLDALIHAKLKLRCFELFRGFDRAGQEALLETVDEFVVADGHLHPAEAKFRGELSSLLDADTIALELEEVHDAARAGAEGVRMSGPVELRAERADHPFFAPLERHYSSEPSRIHRQIGADLELVQQMMELLEEQRADGAGKLDGKKTVQDLAGMRPFLDGHVYAVPALPGSRHELLVVGDLHGCYSCLKAAVMQGRFFEKVEAFRNDPDHAPEPRLVLLGDYIDRGIFSLNGVLRAVMQLFVSAPGHVHVLRGNHEYYVEHKGQIYGGVRPSEAIDSLRPHLPIDVFRRYAQLFDALPNMLLFDRTLFVHGGIPRDRLVKERWKDLSSLNDPDLRFQMMWSDPSLADVIPAALQEQTARFPFGRLQLQSFLGRIGCHTLIRGHEKVNAGVERVYDGEEATLVTVFSAGGRRNADLPPRSSYRAVTPKALLVQHEGGQTTLSPFELDWAAYNDPERNGFFRDPMEIEHRSG